MESINLTYIDNKKEINLLQHLENLDYLKIEWTVPNTSYVMTNDVLGEVTFTTRERKERLFHLEKCKTYSFKILAPCEGFLYIGEELGYIDNDNGTMSWDTHVEFDIKKLQHIAFVFYSMQDLFFYYFKTDKAVLEKDSYTNLHKIHWEYDLRGIFSEDGVIKLDYIDDNAVLVFDSPERIFRKGDCISLRFENDKILDYLVQNEPTKVYPYEYIESYYTYLYYFTLYKEDLDLLLDHELDSYRITYLNNRLPIKTIPSLSLCVISGSDDVYVPEAISIYAKCYLSALCRLVPNYKLPQRSIAENPTGFKFNWCYVYLMQDSSNGYYKIGISNTPEYRERTLQSEKPTIEMLACKKFPTRKIAESIESALHTTYSQQRLRGEWFNLTDADVAAIIETLK